MAITIVGHEPEELSKDILDVNEESIPGYLGRTAVRTAARAGSAIAGLPGDIASAGLGVGNWATGGKIPSYEQIQEKLPISLPTSEQTNKFINEKTGGYTEAQTPFEQGMDEITDLAATIFFPFGKAAKGKRLFESGKAAGKAALGALGRATAGQTAKWATQSATGSQMAGEVAKIGAMALAGTKGGSKLLNTMKNEAYEEAKTKLPKDVRFNFTPEADKIKSIIESAKTTNAPKSDEVLKILKPFTNDIAKNASKVKVDDAIKFKQGLNQWIGESKDKNLKKTLMQAVGTVNEGISRYGKTNKDWYKPWKIGEELTGSLKASNLISSTLENFPKIENIVTNPHLKYFLIHKAGDLITGQPLFAAGAAGLSQAAKSSTSMLKLINKSPVARKLYKDLAQATLNNDVKAIPGIAAKMNSVVDKFEDQHPGFFDEEYNEPKKGRITIYG